VTYDYGNAPHNSCCLEFLATSDKGLKDEQKEFARWLAMDISHGETMMSVATTATETSMPIETSGTMKMMVGLIGSLWKKIGN
jgi:hypothetical protein